ncbi:sensor histidine kinase [Deinococcus sp. PEB2-63]
MLIENTVWAFTPPHERPRVWVQVAPNLPLLPLDATKFNQALGNVVSNAFKYFPQGGEVLVHAWMDPLHPLLHVSVTDQGIGMTAEQRHRAFERFYRADSSGSIPGTGLGLSSRAGDHALPRRTCHAEQRAGAGQCRHADLPGQSRPSVEPCPRKY